MAPLDSWGHAASETCNFFPKISKFENLTFFDLNLNLISICYDKIKLNCILTLIFEFYVEIGP